MISRYFFEVYTVIGWSNDTYCTLLLLLTIFYHSFYNIDPISSMLLDGSDQMIRLKHDSANMHMGQPSSVPEQLSTRSIAYADGRSLTVMHGR